MVNMKILCLYAAMCPGLLLFIIEINLLLDATLRFLTSLVV